MGSCLSKKKKTSPPIIPPTRVPDPNTCVNCHPDPISQPQELQPDIDLQIKNKKLTDHDNGEEKSEYPVKKKEVFVIKHRKSHDGRDKVGSVLPPEEVNRALSSVTPTLSSSSCEILESGAVGEGLKVGVVRTSSCTKEEVDAILIQCGRLSRSSSGKANGRKYSGSKRSYDFDHCDKDGVNSSGNFGDEDDDGKNPNSADIDDDGTLAEKRHHQRQRHRQSSRPSSSQGRRRTPSRERDQNQRSSSRERRVSRSPGRRSSETAASNTSNTSNANANTTTNGGGFSRPAKMVSVPATVSHIETDKSNNVAGGGGTNDTATVTTVKRISVKRNVGESSAVVGSRIASSPRSQSPARTNANVKVSDENQQQPSLSRSSSRKAEQSPYRRNPLSEIDPNLQPHPQPHNNRIHNRSKKEPEGDVIAKDSINGLTQKSKPDLKSSNKVMAAQVDNCKTAGVNTAPRSVDKVVNLSNGMMQQEKMVDGAKGKSPLLNTEVVTVEHQRPQALTRSRSARQSRELDINPEALLNQSQTPSYTKMLLQDIQNFHQKNTNCVSLPACVTKACSIVEAVADLNSATSSNFSCAFSEDRRSPPTYQSSRNDYNVSYGGSPVKKGMPEIGDPFVESEVAIDDDIMKPSFHKYVTVRRGGPVVSGGVDMDDQESSGSNSFVGGVQQQHWGISTASWEPNSADSTDSWTSRQNTRDGDHPDPGSGRSLKPKAGIDMDEPRRRMTERKRDSDSQRNGIGRGRLGGASKVLQTIPVVAATAST